MSTKPRSETPSEKIIGRRRDVRLHAGEDQASILTMPMSGKPNAVLLTNAMEMKT